MTASRSSGPERVATPKPLTGWLALLVTVALVGVVALGQPGPRDDTPQAKQRAAHPVRIRKPAAAPAVETGTTDPHGHSVTVSCNTCHATRPANTETRVHQKLTQFHQGIAGKHGDLACASCHNPADGYTSLRLANGRPVPFTEVMQLCAQCHGPQYRDYLHGAHGGMTGFWDLTRGPRTRNNCVDCHASHAPRYPMVRPARGPGDVPSDSKTKRGGHD
jgi:hypothetical protein